MLDSRTADLVRYEEMLGKAIKRRYGNVDDYYNDLMSRSGEQSPPLVVRQSPPQEGAVADYSPDTGIRMDRGLNRQEALDFGVDPGVYKMATMAHEIEHAKDASAGFWPSTDERIFTNPQVIQRHFLHDRVGEQVPLEGRRALWLMLRDLEDARHGPSIPLK